MVLAGHGGTWRRVIVAVVASDMALAQNFWSQFHLSTTANIS